MAIESEWFGLIGVLIGGGITFLTQQFRIQADVKQAHSGKVDNDLRLFQEAVWTAINAQEHDIGTLAKLFLEGGPPGIGDWLPMETHRTLQNADMLSTRVRNKYIRAKWSSLHKLMNEQRQDVEASTFVLNRTPPHLVGDFYKERSAAWYATSKQVREGYKGLNEAIDVVFDDLANPPSPWPWKE